MALTSLDVSTTGLTEHGARIPRVPDAPAHAPPPVSRSEVGSVLPALRERFAVVHALISQPLSLTPIHSSCTDYAQSRENTALEGR